MQSLPKPGLCVTCRLTLYGVYSAYNLPPLLSHALAPSGSRLDVRMRVARNAIYFVTCP